MTRRGLAWVVFALGLFGCGERTSNLAGEGAAAEIVASPNKATDAGAAPPVASSPVAPTGSPRTGPCGAHPCACANGTDDDGDGAIDGLDPECTGAYDDEEATFGTGAPRGETGSCQDCFFDGNGRGDDDGCARPVACLTDPENVADGGMEGCGECKPESECVENCRPQTPNGCDCFGCCEVVGADGERVRVVLDPRCSLATLDDPEACPRCEQSHECRNACGRCELCPGRTLADLPSDCADGGAPDKAPLCDDGESPCDDKKPCAAGYSCSLGCCIVAVL